MPYCNQCGAGLEQGDRFCPACGAPARRPQVPPSPPPPPGQDPAASGLEVQGVGIRFAAILIDSALVLAFYLIIGRLVAGYTGDLTPDGFELRGGPALAVMGLTLVFWITYFTLLEAYWQGQSLGKKLLGLRVTRLDGGPIDLHAALVRNLLRLVDGQFGYLVGAILIWRSPLKQRLGDRLAHTVVMKKAR